MSPSLFNSIVVVEIKQSNYTQYVILTANDEINIRTLCASTKGAYVNLNSNLYIGCHHYPRLFFILCSGQPLSQNISEMFGKDLQQGLVDFNDLSVYKDVELIGLASLISAGRLVNKLLHTPLVRMRITRIDLRGESPTHITKAYFHAWRQHTKGQRAQK